MISVGVIVGLFYISTVQLEYANYYVLLPLLLLLSTLLGYSFSRLSIEPLIESMQELNAFSKETLHELNIPIATIKMNTQLLQKNLDNEKNLKRLSRINEASLMLELRYKELDYLIKKQSYMDVLEEFNVDELIHSRVESLSSLFLGVNFELNLESFRVKVDKIGLSKVLDNIIENSIKYSDKPVHIIIELHESLLSIKDSGAGMDELTLLKLFDDYYQKDRSSKGYGIGLSMVKRYCDANKIALHVTSSLGVGTSISLNFKGKEIGNS